jgi:hypothetical protein
VREKQDELKSISPDQESNVSRFWLRLDQSAAAAIPASLVAEKADDYTPSLVVEASQVLAVSMRFVRCEHREHVKLACATDELRNLRIIDAASIAHPSRPATGNPVFRIWVAPDSDPAEISEFEVDAHPVGVQHCNARYGVFDGSDPVADVGDRYGTYVAAHRNTIDSARTGAAYDRKRQQNEEQAYRSNEKKISDGWRENAWLRVEGGIS